MSTVVGDSTYAYSGTTIQCVLGPSVLEQETAIAFTIVYSLIRLLRYSPVEALGEHGCVRVEEFDPRC